MGEPKNWDDSDTHATPLVKKAVERLKKEFPTMPIKMVDERYTSKMASHAMIEMGMKKMQRRNKAWSMRLRPPLCYRNICGVLVDFQLIISKEPAGCREGGIGKSGWKGSFSPWTIDPFTIL